MIDAMLYQGASSGELMYLYDWDGALLRAVAGPEEAVAFTPPAKLGYDFAGWVAVTPDALAETFTAYGTAEEFRAAAWGGEEAGLLKAAYVQNGTCNVDADGSRNTLYSLGEIECRVSAMYSRDLYVLLVPITRKNRAGNGVTKAADLILRTNVRCGGKTYYMPVPLNDSDEQTAALFLPGNLYAGTDDNLILTLTNGWKYWNVSATLSANITIKFADIKRTAHLRLINDLGMQAARAALDGTAAPGGWGTIGQSFQYIGVVLPEGDNMGTARNKLLEAFKTCITTGDGLPLTAEQMQYAINNGGAWVAAGNL